MFAFFTLLVLLVFFVYRAAHKCPKCGKYHIKHTNSQIVKNTRTLQLIDQTFVCPDCGHSFVKRVRHEKAPVVIVGGGGSRGGFGGGGFGGGFGGGSFGGGGAGSRF